MTDPEMWREKRERWRPSGHRVSWVVHTKDFAIEFHIAVYTAKIASEAPMIARGEYRGEPCAPFGVEIHSRLPLYDKDKPPDHTDCPVLGGKCWHDGSSLAASEFFDGWQGRDDESAFLLCEQWARARLKEQQDD